MKTLESIQFDFARCKEEVAELGALLEANDELGEKEQIRPFFTARRQLSALLSSYALDAFPPDRMAFEFPLIGDFATDLLVGSMRRSTFCIIEFEDAKRESVFRKTKRAAKEWSPRLEHGFSQVVDWFRTIDDVKTSQRFRDDFGNDHCHFFGFLILGRSMFIDEADRRRLQWRSDKILVDSRKVFCLTFDDVYVGLSNRLKLLASAP